MSRLKLADVLKNGRADNSDNKVIYHRYDRNTNTTHPIRGTMKHRKSTNKLYRIKEE